MTWWKGGFEAFSDVMNWMTDGARRLRDEILIHIGAVYVSMVLLAD